MKLKVSVYYTIDVDEADYDGDPFEIENAMMTPFRVAEQLADASDFSFTVERTPD